jgi:hypothetical protein
LIVEVALATKARAVKASNHWLAKGNGYLPDGLVKLNEFISTGNSDAIADPNRLKSRWLGSHSSLKDS